MAEVFGLNGEPDGMEKRMDGHCAEAIMDSL